ncbi:hypothetical protein ISN44_As11g033900 [Arabidopsis suecica]|uniref:Retrovirus-related Pol polyprotein from transposon TNT 1-94-like beta-barrel domain-containing protein n=1 Tax=Arabidopsis suecica TaxID=45249 RepID=A0A8T1ZFR7_ARASU|nr:hypothetical protein ISN44_As11g033900 [Arabidopsis suecica]
MKAEPRRKWRDEGGGSTEARRRLCGGSAEALWRLGGGLVEVGGDSSEVERWRRSKSQLYILIYQLFVAIFATDLLDILCEGLVTENFPRKNCEGLATFNDLRDANCEELTFIANPLRLSICEGLARNPSIAKRVFSCSEVMERSNKLSRLPVCQLLLCLYLTQYLVEIEPKLPSGNTDPTVLANVQQWSHGDYLCKCQILHYLVDKLYNVYSEVSTSKILWESLETQYKAFNVRKARVSKSQTNKANLTEDDFCAVVTEANVVMTNKSPMEWCLSHSKIEETGKVVLKLTSGMSVTLTNMKHVPDMRKNLIYGTLMNKHGFAINLESDQLILRKNGVFIGKGFVKGGLIKMGVQTVLKKNDVAFYFRFQQFHQ